MRVVEPREIEPMTLVQKGPAHRGADEAGYEFYSTQPGAKIDPSVWGETPSEVIKKLEALFSKQVEEQEAQSFEDWGI